MSRRTIQAGHHPDCYPSDEKTCLALFRKALVENEKTIGSTAAARQNLAGIITPHIDFRVSVASYAEAFSPLQDLPLADTYLILGVGHRSHLEWNLDRRDYLTPLGRAECAGELVDRLTSGPPLHALFSPEAHASEHSIEFPLLWLQALHRLHSSGGEKPVRFIPILCGSLHSYVAGEIDWDEMEIFHLLSRRLGELMKETPSGALRVIVSIDGCHLGPRFQHPFRVNPKILKSTAAWEQELWDCAGKGDARRFLDWMRSEGNDRYFDGVGALALLLAAGAGQLRLQRTYYEQWFTERDASAVTFSSGRVLIP